MAAGGRVQVLPQLVAQDGRPVVLQRRQLRVKLRARPRGLAMREAGARPPRPSAATSGRSPAAPSAPSRAHRVRFKVAQSARSSAF